MKKSPKLIGVIVWTALCILGGLYGSSSAKQNGEQVLALAGIAWLAGLIIWGIIMFIRWFNPERRHSANSALIQLVAVVIVIVIGSSLLSGIQTSSKPTPTKSEPWQAAMVMLGLDPNTPKPTHDQLPVLVCSHFPKSSQTDKLCKKASDDLWNNDLAAFQQHFAKAMNLSTQEADIRAKESVQVKKSSVEFIVILTFLFAIVGAFLSKSIDYMGKITGTALWAVLAAIGYILIVQGSKTNDMVIAFSFGAAIRGFSMLLAIFGAMFTIARDGIKASGMGKYILKVVFAVIGSALGLGLDSLLQLPILTGMVAGGGITMDDAYIMYQLGSMCAGGVTAIIGTGVLFFQATAATPAKDR